MAHRKGARTASGGKTSFRHIRRGLAWGMSTAGNQVVIAGFTDEQAHRLTGVSLRQIRLWDTTGFLKPKLRVPFDGAPPVELYSFRDLVCLRVLNTLRNESRVPMQQLRKVKEKLAHLGEDLWAQTTLYVLNRKVIFDNPQTGSREEVVSGQGVLQIPLRVVQDDMREAIRRLRERPAEARGQIDTRRQGQRNPVVAGTRIPVRNIQALAQAGLSAAEIVREYPSLTEADVEAALGHKLAA